MKTTYVCNVTAGDALPLPAWNFGSGATNAATREHGTSTPGAGQNPVKTNEPLAANPAYGPGPDELPLSLPKWND